MFPQFQSILFKIKLGIKGYLFTTADFEFKNSFLLNSVPIIPFWVNVIPKLQSSLCRIKLSIKEYSGVQILNSTIAFYNSVPKILFLWQIWSQNFKVVCLKWNSVQRGIQVCQLLLQIPSLKYLLVQIWPRNFKLLCLKLNVVQWSI